MPGLQCHDDFDAQWRPGAHPDTWSKWKGFIVLQPLLRAYQRRRRPLNDHHFLVLEGAGLAYCRAPHSADHAIRSALLRLAGADPSQGPAYATGTLRDWTDGLTLLSARQLRRRFPDAIVFTVLRDPLSRLAACYLACNRAKLPAGAGALAAQDGFEAFAAAVCRTPDWKSPNSFRSQSEILTYKRRLLPSHFIRYEARQADWNAFRERIRADGGPDIGDLSAGDDPDAEAVASLVAKLPGSLVEALRRRYRKDYANFYPARGGHGATTSDRASRSHEPLPIGGGTTERAS